MTIVVRRYDPSLRAAWDTLVREAKTGLFLFERDYLDYHADRFVDCSAVAYVDGSPVALLPASIDPASGLATSHAGLTFGGAILPTAIRGDAAIAVIDAMIEALASWGASRLSVKVVPPFLATQPAAEIDYVLWRRGFALDRRDLSSVIRLAEPLPLNTSKRQAVAKARKAGLTLRSSAADLPAFHALLVDVLDTRHDVAPVHSLAELELLAGRFPDRIALHAAYDGEEMHAGALIYRYATAWHTQYLAASEQGRRVGALDLVIGSAIEQARDAGVGWFSFGASTEQAGRVLNTGLLWQKESFGARSVVHDVLTGPLTAIAAGG